jgi:hypothetical protein
MAGTLYEVLGVAASASAEALRAAHRERVRRLHPDVASGDAAAMRTINEAWAVLSDPQRRAAYDRSLAGADDPGRQGAARRTTRLRMRLWPFLIMGAALLVVLTAYAGQPGDLRTQVEPVGQCLIEGADLDRTEPCRSPGGRRIVAVGGPGVQCPGGSDRRALRGDAQDRTVCVGRVAGR